MGSFSWTILCMVVIVEIGPMPSVNENGAQLVDPTIGRTTPQKSGVVSFS